MIQCCWYLWNGLSFCMTYKFLLDLWMMGINMELNFLKNIFLVDHLALLLPKWSCFFLFWMGDITMLLFGQSTFFVACANHPLMLSVIWNNCCFVWNWDPTILKHLFYQIWTRNVASSMLSKFLREFFRSS